MERILPFPFNMEGGIGLRDKVAMARSPNFVSRTHMPADADERYDRALGMDARITRRDFLNSTLLASGVMLMPLSPAALLARAATQQGDDWTGPGGVGDYAASNGDTLAVRLIAHQGSAFYFVPYPYSFLARFYDSIRLKEPRLTYQTWGGPRPEMALSNTPYGSPGMNRGQYGLFFGARFGQNPGLWVIDPLRDNLARAPISETSRAELLTILRGTRRPEWQGRRPRFDGDPLARQLDSITLEDHLMDVYSISRETVRTYLSDEGGGFGLGPDGLSAFCRYAPEMLHQVDAADAVQMFPDGNGQFARLMVKTLLPDSISGPATIEGVCRGRVNFGALDRAGSPTRIRLSSTAVWVQHDGEPKRSPTVTVAYTQGGRVYRVKARSVVVAGGSWTAKHIVRDLPDAQRDAYAAFHRSPAMMANVAVRHWRFLEKLGITGCRWYEGVGSYLQVRRIATIGAESPTINPDQPIVLTLKVLYPHPGLPTAEQGRRGRAEMLATSFREYERRIPNSSTTCLRGPDSMPFGLRGFHSPLGCDTQGVSHQAKELKVQILVVLVFVYVSPDHERVISKLHKPSAKRRYICLYSRPVGEFARN